MTHAHASQMRDHWWWRPGWGTGRRFYTWHLTFDDQPKLHRLVQTYQNRLSGFPALRPVPTEWLHLTIQGLGFTDEVADEEVTAVVAAARERLADLSPLVLTFGPAVVFAEAIVLPPTPAEDVSRVRTTLRAAIADVRGDDNVPESAGGYRPHVSLAYSTAEQPAEPIVGVLEATAVDAVTITVDKASLIVLGRDEGMYRWRTVDSVALTSSSTFG